MSSPSPLAPELVSLSLWEVYESGYFPRDVSPGSCTQVAFVCRGLGLLQDPTTRHLVGLGLRTEHGSWMEAVFGPPIMPAQAAFGEME